MTHKWWQQPSRVAAYVTDTCDDGGDPSLVKMLCLAFALVCIFDMAARHVGAANSALSIVCIATAFGRSTFLAWLNRYKLEQNVSEEAKLNTNVEFKADGTHALDKVTDAIVNRLSPHSPHGGE